MARIRLARWLYGLALLAMPLSYALKDIFGLVGVTWIDPTLILGLAVFFLLGLPIKEKIPLWLIGFAFLSAFAGMFLMSASPDRGKDRLNVYYVEPIRLMLNMIWFWVSISFLKSDRKFVLRWLAICVAWEFFIGCYLYAAFYDLVPVPDAVKIYLEIFKSRQAVYWGDLPIYRMAGTFVESPLFGLFTFCCFVIFVLALSGSESKSDKQFRVWASVGAICAFLGTVASLSDQVLVALLTLGFTMLLVHKGRNGIAQKLLWSSVMVILALYLVNAVATKGKSESAYSGNPIGTSIGERSFHARYALGLFIEQPISMIMGIGPGRYGDYAVRTGYFPSTVTPQITVIEWAVEYGFLGLWLIGIWLFRIGSRAVLGYGLIGAGALAALLIANMFQANWLWESWFLALAFLYSSVRAPSVEEVRV
jgi:hypothetical protein